MQIKNKTVNINTKLAIMPTLLTLYICENRVGNFTETFEFSHNAQSWYFCTTSNVNKLKTAGS